MVYSSREEIHNPRSSGACMARYEARAARRAAAKHRILNINSVASTVSTRSVGAAVTCTSNLSQMQKSMQLSYADEKGHSPREAEGPKLLRNELCCVDLKLGVILKDRKHRCRPRRPGPSELQLEIPVRVGAGVTRRETRSRSRAACWRRCRSCFAAGVLATQARP